MWKEFVSELANTEEKNICTVEKQMANSSECKRQISFVIWMNRRHSKNGTKK